MEESCMVKKDANVVDWGCVCGSVVNVFVWEQEWE